MNDNGFFTTDEQLVVRSWDEWMATASGIVPEEACGRPLAEIFPELHERGLIARFQNVLSAGTIEVLAPAFHRYLFACPPLAPCRHFDQMRQRVTIAPLREDERIVGLVVNVVDVTARMERERELSERLKSSNESERLAAARELSEQPDTSPQPLLDRLNDESWRVRRAAVEGLARQSSSEALLTLIKTLRGEHRNLSILNGVLQALTLSGLDTLTPLVALLTDDDCDLRIYAALALGEQHDQRAVPALLAALDDPEVNVRYHAIEALGKLRAATAVDRLAGIAESRDFYLSFAALDALKLIGEASVAPRLVPLLEDELLRAPAADALGMLGDEDAVAPLAALLNKPSPCARVIAQSLAALYDRYERLYRESGYISELAARHIDANGARNLLAALDTASAEELRSLALVLGWLEGLEIERALTRLIGAPAAHKEVIEALVRYGERVVELLVEQLDSDETETRKAAVIALGRIGGPQVVPPLVRQLDSDPEMVVVVAGALAKLGDGYAYEAMLGLIGHAELSVRQAAIAALNSLGHPEMPLRLQSLLCDKDPLVRESAVKIAGYFGYEECIELLLERCRDEEEAVRRAAIEHLPYIEDERVLDVLAEALQNEKPRVRAAAAHAFAYIDSPQAVSPLLAALNDNDAWVRFFAARSIGRHASSEGLDALARLAQHDSANQVRIAALEALGSIGGVRAVAVLAPFCETEDRDLARAALKALGMIGHPDALPLLLSALRNNDAANRINAAQALGERGGPGVPAALQWAAASDSEHNVVQAAIEALAKLSTPDAISALVGLTADPSRRAVAIEALTGMGAKYIDEIARGLANPQPAVRISVIEALSRMKQTRASDAINTALDDENATVRMAAVNALAHLGSRRAERKLATMARTDPDIAVRNAAQKALHR